MDCINGCIVRSNLVISLVPQYLLTQNLKFNRNHSYITSAPKGGGGQAKCLLLLTRGGGGVQGHADVIMSFCEKGLFQNILAKNNSALRAFTPLIKRISNFSQFLEIPTYLLIHMTYALYTIYLLQTPEQTQVLRLLIFDFFSRPYSLIREYIKVIQMVIYYSRLRNRRSPWNIWQKQ